MIPKGTHGRKDAAGQGTWVDPDVLAKLREGGPGWQTWLNGILRKTLME